MMQVIRDRAQGIVAWIIVAVIAFVFCFWGVSGYINSDTAPVLAVVNGQKITAQEVDDFYNRWLRITAANNEFDINKINPVLIKQQITRGLVEQQAIISSLQRDGLVISDNMLLNSIQNNPVYQRDDKFSIDLYKQHLAQMNMSEAAFEQAQREEMLINQMQMAVANSNFAMPDQADLMISIRNQKRDFGYVIVPAKRFLPNVKVTDEEVAKYYEDHKQTFVVPEMVKLSYVELSVEDLMQKVAVTDANIRDYYYDNVQSFSEPDLINIRHIMVEAPTDSDLEKSGEAEERINEIYTRIKQGEDFVTIAKKESDDSSSAEEGGDLGWISRNDDYPAEVYALKNAGDITEPVQSEWGWHVFQLVGRKGGTIRDFSAVKVTVTERFKREAAEKIFAAKGEELGNIAFENPGSLTAVSEQLDLPIKTTEFFSRQGGTGIAASPNVIQAAFSDDVLKQQHNSDLLRISDDSYVVVRFAEKQEQHQEPLSAVASKIQQLLKDRAAREQAKQMGAQIEQALKDGKLPNKVTAADNLTWTILKAVERDDRKLNRNVVGRAFMMPKPTGAPSIAGWQLPDGDFLVLAVTNVTPGVIENNTDSGLQDMIMRQISTIEARKQVMAMQADLVQQAKIEYKNQE